MQLPSTAAGDQREDSAWGDEICITAVLEAGDRPVQMLGMGNRYNSRPEMPGSREFLAPNFPISKVISATVSVIQDGANMYM